MDMERLTGLGDQLSSEEILDAINAKTNKKTELSQILLMFFVSALLFVGAGLISSKIEQLIILVIVLLVHESGHYLAMKSFGYADVKMFFLPFFGAATSGNENNPNATAEDFLMP